MKKLMIMIAIVIGLSTPVLANNVKVLNMAPEFDNRIRSAQIAFGNTVVLIGHWPRTESFDAENVASGWCGEFDDRIKFVQLRQYPGDDSKDYVGGARCS
jgi:hypothetical protein